MKMERGILNVVYVTRRLILAGTLPVRSTIDSTSSDPGLDGWINTKEEEKNGRKAMA